MEIGRRPEQLCDQSVCRPPSHFTFQSISRWFAGVDQRDFHLLPKRRSAFFFFQRKFVSTGRLGHWTKLVWPTFRRDAVFNLQRVTLKKTTLEHLLWSFQKISTHPENIWGSLWKGLLDIRRNGVNAALCSLCDITEGCLFIFPLEIHQVSQKNRYFTSSSSF